MLLEIFHKLGMRRRKARRVESMNFFCHYELSQSSYYTTPHSCHSCYFFASRPFSISSLSFMTFCIGFASSDSSFAIPSSGHVHFLTERFLIWDWLLPIHIDVVRPQVVSCLFQILGFKCFLVPFKFHLSFSLRRLSCSSFRFLFLSQPRCVWFYCDKLGNTTSPQVWSMRICHKVLPKWFCPYLESSWGFPFQADAFTRNRRSCEINSLW